jgi:leader peptidase (prepilin peptidase)/N-methyltransferase
MNVLSLLSAEPTLFLVITGVLGLIVGSFLNVVILRLPMMLERQWRAQCAHLRGTLEQAGEGERFDLIWPRSHCPHCRHTLSAWENIPLLSYLLLRGQCAACRGQISPRYALVELLTAVLSIVVAWRFGLSGQTLFAWLLTWALVSLIFIDLDHQLLPDSLTLPVLWLGILISLFGIFTDTRTSVIGAMAGYLSLWSVYHLFKWMTGKEGMGYGDFKLFALFGAWLGWQSLPLVILLSSLVGAVVGMVLILVRGRDRNLPIPFGPYLAGAGWIALLWGQEMLNWYTATWAMR